MEQYKIALLGDSFTGKSSLLYSFKNNSFTSQQASTIGIDYHLSRFTVKEQIYQFAIFDTSGDNKFDNLVENLLLKEGIHAALLCFDLTDLSTLVKVNKWILFFRVNKIGVKLIIVGTKKDIGIGLKQSQLSKICSNYPYVEISAIDTKGTISLFHYLFFQTIKQNEKQQNQLHYTEGDSLFQDRKYIRNSKVNEINKSYGCFGY